MLAAIRTAEFVMAEEIERPFVVLLAVV